VKIERFPNNPIIRPNMRGRIGSNINGPSLIRAPEWLPNRLGRYYLYFAHHQGKFIRLAYADRLGLPYFRVFRWDGYHYALGMPGRLYRSKDGLTDFEGGPVLFSPNMRHSALKLDGVTLKVFYSDVGDAPERILLSTIDLTPDWTNWQESEPATVLKPELEYEGSDLPIEPSVRGWAPERVRQLHDPAIFRDNDETYLLYSVAGEYGLAIARLIE
jgi:hypothetical protein